MIDANENAAPTTSDRPCPICSSPTAFVGTRRGKLDAREYAYWHCDGCGFSFVADPRSDFANIYTESYYHGMGADPLVDYAYELKHPDKTIRNYEWRGIVSIYQRLCRSRGKWLDFGCGCGGLVAFGRRLGIDVVGFDEGWGACAGRAAGIPILSEDQLSDSVGQYDFISAIEVIEHLADPQAALTRIRSLLKPGGILFLTTGNAEPWRGKFLRWGYLSGPEVHVAFFEPRTLEIAYRKAGLEPAEGSSLPGYVDIIKYKVLKIMRVRNVHRVFGIFPWKLICWIVDKRHQVTRQPYAVLGPQQLQPLASTSRTINT